ncbi:MAG: hypothetical protein M3R09_00620 [Actinomycetota bacterium]|nr:hypothetical protein [Actinomycetota bacterium]
MLADDRLDALFRAVPDEFTAARDGLVKQGAQEQQPPAQGLQQRRRAEQAERRRVEQLERRRRAEEALQKTHAAADGAEASRKRAPDEVRATTREAETAQGR